MASKKRAVKRQLLEYLRETGAERVTEADWASLSERFPEASSHYLRRLLRESGLALDPLVEGVRQDGFEELERSLLALGRQYSEAKSRSDTARAMLCRDLVKEAKEHARWAARRSRDVKAAKDKAEMAEWMLVWLEDPSAFALWANLRKRQREAEQL